MNELITFLLGMAPISEVRGAIPYGISAGLSLPKTMIFAVLGNLLPIIPLLLFLETISKWLMKHSSFFGRFFTWLFARTRRHSDVVEKYEALGLLLFVGIPLPMTGAWSGCIAAFIFGIHFWRAFLAITAGVLMATVIVTIVMFGLINLGSLAQIFLK